MEPQSTDDVDLLEMHFAFLDYDITRTVGKLEDCIAGRALRSSLAANDIVFCIVVGRFHLEFHTRWDSCKH